MRLRAEERYLTLMSRLVGHGSELKKEVHITQGHDWAPFWIFSDLQVLHGTRVSKLGILTPQDSFGSDGRSPS